MKHGMGMTQHGMMMGGLQSSGGWP
jgi:hypothetical protein